MFFAVYCSPALGGVLLGGFTCMFVWLCYVLRQSYHRDCLA